MRIRYVIALVIGAVVVAQVAPAFGAPSLGTLAKKVSSLQRSVSSLRANDLYLLQQIRLMRLTTTVVTADMTEEPGYPGFYRGSARCPAGSDLTGGGTGWGQSSYQATWRVNHSGPSTGGMAWEAGVLTGSAGATTAPKVYAVCDPAN